MLWIDLQNESPGNVALHFLFIGANFLGANGAGIVAEIHPKGEEMVGVGVGDNIANEMIIGAVFVLKHALNCGKDFLLKSSICALQCHVNQVADASFRIGFDFFQRSFYRCFNQDARHIWFHSNLSFWTVNLVEIALNYSV